MSRLDDQLIVWLGPRGPDAAGLRHGPGPASDVAMIGGKGASLDRLGRLGFRVPPGFCVTTAAFRAQLATALEGAPSPSLMAPERVAERLAAGPLAPAVRSALASAVGQLADELRHAGFSPRLAVRSSAVAEDGSAASYAGLHETELDVPPPAVDGAVRRCWASLWSPAAVAYRRRRDVPSTGVEMAVVVQALVPAETSAVVFTRHPVTGREDQIVITSTRGLGDAMVAGTITPDMTIVAKPSRATIEFDPGDGSYGPAGAALAPPVLDALVDLSLQVEARFGQPVDIEAAYAGGAWFLLQARPITTGASTDAPVSAA